LHIPILALSEAQEYPSSMVIMIQLFFLFADCTNCNAIKKYYHCGLYNLQLFFSAPFTLQVVQTASINISKCIAVCTTSNAFKKNYIAGCTTRNVFINIFVLRFVQPTMHFKKN